MKVWLIVRKLPATEVPKNRPNQTIKEIRVGESSRHDGEQKTFIKVARISGNANTSVNENEGSLWKKLVIFEH